jgi:diguanylate cyclase
LLYTYVTGVNTELNRTIDTLLKLHGKITLQEISLIFDEFISRDHLGQKIEEIGDQIGGEIDNTMALLSETSESTGIFSSELARGRSDLLLASSRKDLDGIVARLALATDKADAVNRRLAQQLDEARGHISDLQKTLETVRFECLTDDLTTLANRRHFDNSLTRAVREAEASGKSFALLMVDIDHFKQFNDTFGHQTGDQVLRLVALSLKQTIKGKDIACRYGGEEFGIILPNTKLAQAAIVAEHVRNAVMTKELVKRSTGENLGRITISLGVAVWRKGDLGSDIVARADRALYAAKRGGRNAVRRETDPDVLKDETAA